MHTKKILYIEDNQEIGEWVNNELIRRGYDVQWLLSGDEIDQDVQGFDIVILDIMLPGLDGFTIGQRLKKQLPQTPILLLSARTDIHDKLHGLKFADDYVTKPFHLDELVARVEVLLRRSGRAQLAPVKLGQHLDVHLAGRTVIDTRSGEEVALTAKEFQILDYFLRHPNQILTQEQIWAHVWGESYLVGDKALSVHIRHLREKLEQDPGAPVLIQTVRGIGYRVKL